MRINEALANALLYSDTPRIDLEVLLGHAIKQPRSFLYANPEYQLSQEQEQTFITLCAQRINGEPIAYILGKKEFWSLELVVDYNVLIPRPETELLVTTTLDKLNQETAVVADLGTGSGAIALALANEQPNWTIAATDISEPALKIAKLNDFATIKKTKTAVSEIMKEINGEYKLLNKNLKERLNNYKIEKISRD